MEYSLKRKDTIKYRLFYNIIRITYLIIKLL